MGPSSRAETQIWKPDFFCSPHFALTPSLLPPYQREYFAEEEDRIRFSLFKEHGDRCQTGFINSFSRTDKVTAASNLIYKSKKPTTPIKASGSSSNEL